MTRSTSETNSTQDRFDGEDDEPYRAIVVRPKDGWLKKGDPKATDFRHDSCLVIELEVKGHKITARDYISLKTGVGPAGVAKFKQLLNALAEQPKETEFWWEDDFLQTGELEWDYGDQGHSVKLVEGMMVIFKGENRGADGSKQFRITGYKSAAKKS